MKKKKKAWKGSDVLSFEIVRVSTLSLEVLSLKDAHKTAGLGISETTVSRRTLFKQCGTFWFTQYRLIVFLINFTKLIKSNHHQCTPQCPRNGDTMTANTFMRYNTETFPDSCLVKWKGPFWKRCPLIWSWKAIQYGGVCRKRIVWSKCVR